MVDETRRRARRGGRAGRVPVALSLLGAGLLSGSLLPSGVPQAAAAEAPSPVLHYAIDADDVSSGTVTDSSGNGLDGTLVNPSTATMVDSGAGGSAVQLPGGAPDSNGAYLRLPRQVLAGRTDLTVSMRVRWDGGGAWQRLFDLGESSSRSMFATPANGDGDLRTAITVSGGGGESQVTGSAALPTDTWKTVTVTLDTAADKITTYLDGAAVGSNSTTLTASDVLGNATSAGYIGKSMYADPLLAGAVDDVAVYAAALTPEQVAQVYGGPVPTATTPQQTSFDVRTTIGNPPPLPPTVMAGFSDGYDRPLAIAWEDVPPEKYAQRGSFTVTGTTANGVPVTATVTVVREGEMTIDLGTDTGAFHGGAAGTLYGLYGPGVPSNNLIEGMHLRTVATKAQDGAQHPGADALEVVKPLADSTDGDVYVYMTDIHRGFPYEWPGDTPEDKMRLYKEKIARQVDQVLKLDPKYQDNIVFVPFNEPEGNMFGTGQWSYDKVSWLDDPTDYYRAWDEVYRLIKGKMPDARIAGPNTSVLYPQVKGWLQHTVEAGTVPDVITWHELSHPEQVRTSVATYRQWEQEVFAGTRYAGTKLPINVDEYAFNYHTSVPGQMIQWISAIEESKVDADIAYWNIDGNLSDSAVQANRGNGQWWLFNAYGSMTGHTVEVDPPFPGQNYTLQGVATLDEARQQARAIIGGSTGKGYIQFDHVPASFGSTVHAWVREIPWTGQIGDSPQPELIAERNLPVTDGKVAFDFGGDLPTLKESSAYEIELTPAGEGKQTSAVPDLWTGSYEAEDAKYTGSGYSKNGPEGSPKDVSKFYTSGGYDVGGLRTGSDGVLDFTVDVPKDGRYDLSVFANSLNTYPAVQDQGPTNVFLRVDGGQEQEMHLPLGYKWVVWDHADTTVQLTAGRHVISLAARSLDGSRTTKGDTIVDRITLGLPNPAARTSVYEAELADLDGGRPLYTGLGAPRPGEPISGSGVAQLAKGDSATFWVYSARDAEAKVVVDSLRGQVRMAVNGTDVLTTDGSGAAAVSLSGGINKVTLTGLSTVALVDDLAVTPATGSLPARAYEAEAAQLAGSTTEVPLSLASGGVAVDGIGGAPGNDNTLTFRVQADRPGTYAMRVRYSNPEQSPATHYNPDPLARRADISVNGAKAVPVLFPHSFHKNNFWELTVPVTLAKGTNTISFASQEQPNFDGTTYASDTVPGVLLRSKYAPLIDKIAISRYSAVLR